MLVTTLSRIVALFLVLITILLFGVAVWNFGVQATVFNPDTFKNGLDNEQIYAEAVPVVLPAIIEIADIQTETELVNIHDIISAIGVENWHTVTNELVPPEWLQAQIETGIDAIFAAVMEGDDNALDETIAIDALRDRMTGPSAERAVDYILRSAPDCTNMQNIQLRSIANSASSRVERLPICNPSTQNVETSRGILLDALEEWADHMSDHTTVAEMMEMPHEEDEDTVTQLHLVYDTYQQLSWLSFLCPAGLLALVVAVAVRSLKGFGLWIGGTSVITGLVALIPLVLIPLILLEGMVESAQATNQIEQFQVQVAAGITRSAFSQLSGVVVAQAAAFVGVGFILFIIAVISPTQPTIPPGSVLMTADGQIISTTPTPTPVKVVIPTTGDDSGNIG